MATTSLKKTAPSKSTPAAQRTRGAPVYSNNESYPGSTSPLDPSRALRKGGQTHPKGHVERVQRERLIDGFVLTAADVGYDKAMVKAICKRAGVAFNTFYVFFQSKEELFIDAYDQGTELLIAQVNAATPKIGSVPWKQRVETTLTAFLTILADNPAFAKLIEVEALRVGPAIMKRVDNNYMESFTLFKDAEARDDLKLTTKDLMPLVTGGIHARLSFHLRSNKTKRLSDLAPDLTTFVLASFQERKGAKRPAVKPVRRRSAAR